MNMKNNDSIFCFMLFFFFCNDVIDKDYDAIYIPQKFIFLIVIQLPLCLHAHVKSQLRLAENLACYNILMGRGEKELEGLINGITMFKEA